MFATDLFFLFRERYRVAPSVIQHLVSNSSQSDIEAGMTLVWFIVDTSLVGIDEIVLSKLVGCEVRHDDIGASDDGFLATLWVNGLVGGGSHHIDFRHHQTDKRHYYY